MNNWPVVPLWSKVDDLRSIVTPDLLGEQFFHYSIPVVDETGTGRVEEAADVSSAKMLLSGGEVLISKLNPRKGRVLIAEAHQLTVAASPEFIALRPHDDLDGNFLSYLLSSEIVRQFLDSQVQSVTRSHQRVTPELVRHILVALPPVIEQRCIAKFLDVERRRLDDMIGVQSAVLKAIAERRQRVIEDLLIGGSGLGERSILLSRLVEYGRPITYGIVLPGPDVPDGVPIVKGGDVAANRLSLAALKRTTHEIAAAYHRSRLREGDLVISIRGSVGEVAHVPLEIEGANLTQDAARIAPAAHVSGRWLQFALQSPTVQAEIRSLVTGATIKGLNIYDLCRVRVPCVARSEQEWVADRVTGQLSEMDDLSKLASRQVKLMRERHGALVTAAVTGQIDVSTASGVTA